jgi:hypothetical protein
MDEALAARLFYLLRTNWLGVSPQLPTTWGGAAGDEHLLKVTKPDARRILRIIDPQVTAQ